MRQLGIDLGVLHRNILYCTYMYICMHVQYMVIRGDLVFSSEIVPHVHVDQTAQCQAR